MSGTAARGAAGYLYASGRMRGRDQRDRLNEALRAAEDLKRERERKSFQPRRNGARR